MNASTSPEPGPRTVGAIHVAVVDDRALVKTGVEAALIMMQRVVVHDVATLPPGGFALVGSCAVPFEPPIGIRVRELTSDRSVADVVRALRGDGGTTRRAGVGRALSKRERTILSMTANGASAMQIAGELGVSARTVERHRRAVADKLAVRSSLHAVAVDVSGDDSRKTG